MTLQKELIFLLLQFCDEEDLKKTAHMLEHETGIFFDMQYFEDLVLSGNWDEAERYLLGFTGVEDNKYSIKIYFEMRKQKFLEALDENDRAKALDILVNDLKVFAPSNEELYKEMTQLLTLDDFRMHSALSWYSDVPSARKCLVDYLRKIIEANPLFHGKLNFPQINASRLRRLINQGLNWQHVHCRNPQPEPEIKNLYRDHQCPTRDDLEGQLNGDIALSSEFTSASVSNSPGTSASNSFFASQSEISDVSVNLATPINQGIGAPTSQASSAVTNEDAILEGGKDNDSMSKAISNGTSDEPASVATFPTSTPVSRFDIPFDFPKSVGRILNLGSSATSLDFHPVLQTFLLVGTNVGDIELWEVISGERLLVRKFSVWKIPITSLEGLVKDPSVSINRILWSPDGSLFGVAYSKRIVQLYAYHSGSNVQEKLEIEAHAGAVNDIVFSNPNEQLFVVTCGDDRLIKVWNVETGTKQYTLEGHEAPVYSICPHEKQGVHFLFSTSTNGEIKAWLYDDLGPRVSYDAPGKCCTRMAYSADGKRLFSCGTNELGESFIVEWEESEGYLIRRYSGHVKSTSGVVGFDTSKSRYLAAGDDHLVKIWDMDNVELLGAIDADGGLPGSPYIRFNKKGNLLAVSTNNNKIKILANDCSLQLLQTSEKHGIDTCRDLFESLKRAGDTAEMNGTELKSTTEAYDISEVQKLCKIDGPLHCQSLRLLSEVKMTKVTRLMYNNAGSAILALTADGIHLLWRWTKNENNSSGKATTKVSPKLWQPKSGLLMTNHQTRINSTGTLSCFALSKNDSYVVSSSGGKISLFNMLTFKAMKTFMPPPPAATCIAFYPNDNNILAIGMEDSTILIYNVRVDEVICKLQGHSNGVTAVAFSGLLNVLVSSGGDAKIIVWDSFKWEQKMSTMLEICIANWFPSLTLGTWVQFHHDQIHLLVVHETQLVIYETTKLEPVKKWSMGNFDAHISCAAFSCDSQLVYVGLSNGIVLIFDVSNLIQQGDINPTAYLASEISSKLEILAIATNPKKPDQFALGLNNGEIVVIEPLESKGEWGVQM